MLSAVPQSEFTPSRTASISQYLAVQKERPKPDVRRKPKACSEKTSAIARDQPPSLPDRGRENRNPATGSGRLPPGRQAPPSRRARAPLGPYSYAQARRWPTASLVAQAQREGRAFRWLRTEQAAQVGFGRRLVSVRAVGRGRGRRLGCFFFWCFVSFCRPGLSEVGACEAEGDALAPAASRVEGRSGGRVGPGVRSAVAASRHDCEEGRSRFAPEFTQVE